MDVSIIHISFDELFEYFISEFNLIIRSSTNIKVKYLNITEKVQGHA